MARAGAQVAELTPVEILRANGGRKARLSGHGQSPVAQLAAHTVPSDPTMRASGAPDGLPALG